MKTLFMIRLTTHLHVLLLLEAFGPLFTENEVQEDRNVLLRDAC